MALQAIRRYEYMPLDQAQGEQTRLLCLAAGTKDEDISATMRSVSMESGRAPDYTALSYTWGTMSKDAIIYIDSMPLEVTSNLLAALKHLRREHEECWVWVDAICINQADDAEKSFQVPNMHVIYQKARSCLVWLGSPFEDSELAMHAISRLDLFDLKCEDFHKPEWIAAIKLIEHEFWRRVWILQELIWATDVQVTCGGARVSISQFFRLKDELARVLGEGVHPGAYTLYLIQRFRARTYPSFTVGDRIMRPLLDLLTVKVSMHATDPRDHVFGILSLLPQAEWPSKPDYSTDVREVFAETAAKVLTTTKSLEFLRLCSLNRQFVRNPKEFNCKIPQEFRRVTDRYEYASLPSWVPNWARLPVRASQNQFCQYSGSGFNIFTCDAGFPNQVQMLINAPVPLLMTRTIIYDSIQSFLPLKVTGERMEPEMLDSLKQIAFNDKDRSAMYATGECNLEDALWRTLMLDCNCSDSPWRAHEADVADFAKRVQDGSNWKLSTREYLDLIERTFFTTASGLFGIVSDACEIGSVIAIIPTCSVPIVLHSYGYGGYSIAGEAYVHGLMDGEVKSALDRGECELVNICII